MAPLLEKGEELIVALGFGVATLWVLEANERGRRFYEARDWQCEGTTHSFRLGEADVVEVRYCKVLA